MEALSESAAVVAVAEDDLEWLNDLSSDDDGGAGAEAAAARPRSSSLGRARPTRPILIKFEDERDRPFSRFIAQGWAPQGSDGLVFLRSLGLTRMRLFKPVGPPLAR